MIFSNRLTKYFLCSRSKCDEKHQQTIKNEQILLERNSNNHVSVKTYLLIDKIPFHNFTYFLCDYKITRHC